MSTSQHTCQIAHDVLGQYISIGMEEPETPHQFPPQPTNPPTAPTPIETNTFVHIPDSPALSPSPFQFLPQEASTMEIHPTEEQSHLTLVSAPVSRTSTDTSGTCPSSLHTSGSTIHPCYPHQVARHLQWV